MSKPAPAIFNAGKSFTPKDAKKPRRNKAARRMIRKVTQLRSSAIDSQLHTVRRADREVAQLADNSHERQRAIAADRIERKGSR